MYYLTLISEKIVLNTSKAIELINITSRIQEIVEKSGVTNALVNISTKHTTSAVVINEDEKGLKRDVVSLLDKLVPNDSYEHDLIDNNARSHLMSLLLSSNQTLSVVGGRINLGTWQSIFFLELDGPRSNRIVDVSILY